MRHLSVLALLTIAVAGPVLAQGKGKGGGGSGGSSSCTPTGFGGFDHRLVATGDVEDEFGKSLAISPAGDRLAVGYTFGEDVVIFDMTYDGFGAPVLSSPVLLTVPGASGWAVDLGDVDGDGDLDLVVADRLTNGGTVRVVLDLDPATTVSLTPPAGAPVRFGAAVEVGDLDGDLADEIAVGAPAVSQGRDAAPGAVYIYDFDGTGFPAQELANPVEEKGDGFGRRLALGSNVLTDGPALVVAAPEADGGSAGSGISYVYDYAASLTALGSFYDGVRGEGLTVAAIGDLDGTGLDDAVAITKLSASSHRRVWFQGELVGANPVDELAADPDLATTGPASIGASDLVIGSANACQSLGAVFVYELPLVPGAPPAPVVLQPTDGVDTGQFGWQVAALPGSDWFLVSEPRQGRIHAFERTAP